MTRIFIIGIGYKPLDKRSREIILRSETILSSARLFDVFALYEEYNAVMDRIRVINNIGETMDFMKAALNKHETSTITLLASGDPMFFGIGRRALEEFGKDLCEILPDMSSMQLAFARIKEPWDDALLMSLHGGPDPKRLRKLEYALGDIPSLVVRHKRIGILTDKVNNPSVIAQTLLSSCGDTPLPALRLYVCEKLGYPNERVIEGSASEIAALSFSDPNVVIIKNTEVSKSDALPHPLNSILGAHNIRFGLTEDEILHSRGLITKDEVRATTIHKLRLPSTGVLWDIGAGSGAVSMEAARLCPDLRIYAVEKDAEQIDNIIQNCRRFRLSNVDIIKGVAPEALSELPSPDSVFIGGSGGRIDDIISYAAGRMPAGVIVVNAATLETFTLATNALNKARYSVEASQISVSRMKPIGEGHFFSAQNPIFVIQGKK
jgi:precorrin-6B C5,15-methyltransferase / cobalt-precorrin-6B C5,C15-methyltransferase